ncbi:MAG: PTS sugar transporter subunit IIA [Planctomycetota bacterium]|nr:PTS sugar transporter subunit IIA [Planctomycetota bacterium]
MSAIEITQHCRAAHCLPVLQGETKMEVISELIRAFVASGAIAEDQAPELFGEIVSREEEATTGIGRGVAMPHARSSAVVSETLVGVGLHSEGVDFDSLDGAPVHVVFLIATADPAQYLPVAARIARIARDDVEMKALQRQATAIQIHKFLEESWSSCGTA